MATKETEEKKTKKKAQTDETVEPQAENAQPEKSAEDCLHELIEKGKKAGKLTSKELMMPDAKTIGVLYTTSEANSVSQLAKLKALAPTYGFEIVDVGVTDASEVATGAQTLVSKKVDCVDNLTDNNVVNNLSVVANATNAAGIPIFGSEIEQVAKYGCVASETLDYVALGKTTGEMAAKILKGADVKTMPVSVVTDSKPVYSLKNMQQFKLTLPAEYSSATNTDTQG